MMRVVGVADNWEIENESEDGEVLPLDSSMIETLASAAIATNPESEEIEALLKSPDRFFNLLVVDEEEDDGPWLHYYVVTSPEELERMKAKAEEMFGPDVDVPSRIYVGSFQMRHCGPNQN